MERRNFIKNVSLTTIGISSFPSLAFNLPTNKTNYYTYGWVTTAITIAKIAISASEMFKGTSSDGISDIQILMLENISKQLKVVQDGINTIIEDIAEVKSLIGELPQQVVQELLQKKIQGNITTFDELMKTYVNYGNDKTKFISNHQNEVEDLIKSIRDNRNVLMKYENYLNIPLLSTALYMEYNCMQLIDEKTERILPVIETYKSYFTNSLYGSNKNNLEFLIKNIRQARTDYLIVANETQHFECRVHPWSSGHAHWYIRSGFYKFSSELNYDYEKEQVEELISLGLITNKERVNTVSLSHQSRMGRATPATWSGNVKPDGYINPHEERKSVSSLPVYNDFIKKCESKKVEIQEKINFETLKLYTAVSCFHSGNRALNFCNSF